ncbi:hypothetical protein HC928_18240 [bacterium]|nr:hypothetical protein [bacterium]
MRMRVSIVSRTGAKDAVRLRPKMGTWYGAGTIDFPAVDDKPTGVERAPNPSCHS